MKLQALFQNRKKKWKYGTKNPRGFLVMEVLVALAVMTLIVPAALFLSLSNTKLVYSAQTRLDSIPDIANMIENGTDHQIASSSLLYESEFGKSTCALVPDNITQGFTTADIHLINSNTVGTSLTARNGYVYETANLSSSSTSAFFIIDIRNTLEPVIVSSISIGTGLSAVTVSGYYAYVANESTVAQLIVIDIHDRTHPFVVARLKLPLPYATSTAPYAASIFYDKGFIYLGTQKWDGTEFNIIDVSNPVSPTYVNGFETNSLVNSVYEYDGYAYVATASTDEQMRVVDVRNPLDIIEVSHFSPAGSAVLEGKTFAFDSGVLYFARDGGGFNNPNQYELFSFNLASDQFANSPTHVRDIAGGIYGIVGYGGYIFLATGSSSSQFQIWKNDFSKEVYSAVLPSKPIFLACDHNRLYAEFSDSNGVAVIVPH